MNSDNSKRSDSHRLTILQSPNLTIKINWKRSDTYVSLSNFSVCYTWKNIQKSYKNNKFKTSSPTWNEEFQLPDGSYSVSDIEDYFETIIKKHEAVADNHWLVIYVNKIENKSRILTLTFNAWNNEIT